MEFNYVELRLFINPENIGRYDDLKSSFFSLLGFDLTELFEKNGAKELSELKDINDKYFRFSESISSGFEDRKIIVLHARLSGKKNAKGIFDSIVNSIGVEQKKSLLLTTDSRVDADLNYFIRLDMDALLKGSYVLTDKGSCYHFTFSLVTYPKDRDKAIEGITSILS